MALKTNDTNPVSLKNLCYFYKDLYETTSEEEDDVDEMLEEGGDDTLQRSNGVVDVEDLGKVMKNMKKAKVCVLLMIPKV